MRIERNIKLANYTTFHIGGRAEFFTEVKNIIELEKAVNFSKKNKLKILIIGGGSNILLPDNKLKSLVIKMNIRGIYFENNSVYAGAGEVWDKLVSKVVLRNLGGIENLSFIPGTVGGAIYQNIGAYGTELGDVLESVKIFDIKSKSVRELTNDECNYGYRDSIFQKSKGKGWIILGTKLELKKEYIPNLTYPDLKKYFSNKGGVTLKEVRLAVIKIRKAKLVYPTPNLGTAGSFFKNPVVTSRLYNKLLTRDSDIKGKYLNRDFVKLSAGQLIEKSGWKGKKLGNVSVSSKHALVLVAHKGAQSKDIINLAKLIQKSVKDRFGVKLESEVRIIT